MFGPVTWNPVVADANFFPVTRLPNIFIVSPSPVTLLPHETGARRRWLFDARRRRRDAHDFLMRGFDDAGVKTRAKHTGGKRSAECALPNTQTHEWPGNTLECGHISFRLFIRYEE
jgi:hypothetical protein